MVFWPKINLKKGLNYVFTDARCAAGIRHKKILFRRSPV